MTSKYKALGECIDLIIDHRGKTPKKMGGDWIDKGVMTISAKNVHGGKLDNLDSIRYVSYEVYKKWMKEDIKRGDCLLASEGATLGENLYWNSDEKVVIGQRLYCIRTNNNILDSKYFSAYLNTHEYQKEIEGRATGTSVLGIKQTDLLKTMVLIKDIDEQRFIGNLYLEINEKIEVNNKINKKLEEMAQAIFKQWFVDFEFPNKDGEPYKSNGGELVESEIGKIPNNWNVVTLGDYVEIKHGYAFKSEYFSDNETDNILLTPGNFKIGGGFYDKKFKYYLNDGEIKKEYILKENDLIITMTDLSKDGDTLGYPAVVPEIKGKTLLHNQRLGKIEVSNNKITKEFIYYLMRNPYYRHHILATATGTTVRHTAPKRVADYKFTIPNDSKLVDKFTCLCRDIIQKNNKIISENRCLIEIRETLLPKLMSGEIRVHLKQD